MSIVDPNRKQITTVIDMADYKALNDLIPRGNRNVIIEVMIKNFIHHLRTNRTETLERLRPHIFETVDDFFQQIGAPNNGPK